MRTMSAKGAVMPQFLPSTDITLLSGGDGFRMFGVNPDDRLGYCIGNAGDVNGDGIGDIMLFAKGVVSEAYVVFGHSGAFAGNLNLALLDGSNGFRLDGLTPDRMRFGVVASAGDINGDGYDDMIFGDTFAASGTGNPGASYVVYGRPSGFAPSLNVASLDGTNGFKLTGGGDFDYTGISVSGGGDINGDGFDDMIVGSRLGPDFAYQGQTYVVFGKASGFGANLDLATLTGTNGFQLIGAAGDEAGVTVSNAGDVNNDGFDDVLVGSSSGKSYVVFGKAGGFDPVISLTTLDGTNGFRMNPPGLGAHGYALSQAGDVNGDGFDDIIVGDHLADSNGVDSGSAFVVFGHGGAFSPTLNLASLNGVTGFRIRGDAFALSGFRVSDAGDVNGDGFADVIVSAAETFGFTRPSAYVVFGKASGFTATVNLSTLNGNNGFVLDGEFEYGPNVRDVSAAGDVNGDGFDDIMVSNADGIYAGTQGTTYVVFGHKPLIAVNRVGTVIDNTIHGSDLGDTLSGLDGNDTLIGWAGIDTLLGGNGTDTLTGGAGADTLDGGASSDTASYATSAGAIEFALDGSFAALGDVAIDTLISIERLAGTNQGDRLRGDGLVNRLAGNGGDDTLEGMNGNDILVGGLGLDRLTGGLGIDRFDFDSIAESTAAAAGRDIIADFNEAATDKIDLSTIDANSALAGNNAFSFIGAAAFTGLGQVRVIQTATTTFIDINTTGSTAADMRIQLTGLHTLDVADFVL
jgi:Ca2+-binding RTX toxin-like protein